MTALTGGLLKLVAAGLVCGCLLTLSCKGAQKELLRFGCACLMVVLLLSFLRQTDLPVFDLDWYEGQVTGQVEAAQRQARREQLEQASLALEQVLERQAASLGLTCTFGVTCTADSSGLVTVERVTAHYHDGPRERLQELQQWAAAQLAVPVNQIIIQEASP